MRREHRCEWKLHPWRGIQPDSVGSDQRESNTKLWRCFFAASCKPLRYGTVRRSTGLVLRTAVRPDILCRSESALKLSLAGIVLGADFLHVLENKFLAPRDALFNFFDTFIQRGEPSR